MSSFINRLLLVVLVIGLTLTGYSQQFNFKKYSVKDGLANATVNAIFQDSKGHIWFATQGGGICRFNGKEFTTYTKKEGLINNDVTCITEDKKGHIWIGTSSGASEFDGKSFISYSQQNGFSDNTVYGIYAGEDKIWFAVYDAGIKIYDGKKFDSLTVSNGLPSNEAFSVTCDQAGTYWFGLGTGICSYDGKKITDYSSEEAISQKGFFSSLLDRQGNLWFGSTSGGVVVIYKDKRIENIALPKDLQSDFIGSITQDKKNNIWLATDHGVLKYTQGKFALFTEKEGLSLNSVLCVATDYEDNIWIGTLTGGVNQFTGQQFIYYKADGLKTSNITSICPDRIQGNYYVGTAGDGLSLFNAKAPAKFRHIDVSGLEKTNISSMAFDSKGLLWIAAQEGIFVLEKKRDEFVLKQKIDSLNGIQIGSAHKVLHDWKGNTWIASYGDGLFLISPTTKKCFATKTGFASDKILTLFEDSKHTIWIGTIDAGVFKYDGTSFIAVPRTKSNLDPSVWAIAEDNAGNMYFGTAESGLYCYDGKKVIAYTTRHGLSSNAVTALEWDKNQNLLWLGTEKGLNKIKLNKQCDILSIQTYSERQGYNSYGINHDAVYSAGEGIVWIGTINGLLCYNPAYDIPRQTPPKIELSGIRLAYQKVDWHDYADSVEKATGLPVNLQLKYYDNHLVFDIQALTTDNVSYTFKLEGQDKDWSPLTQNAEVNYSNITPGRKYTFRVKAVNSNGIWSEESKPFTFEVLPPWWNSTWFRVVAIITLISGLTLFIKLRERVLRKQNQRLEATVEQRTEELVREKKMVEEKNVIISHEKQLSESLLHNILPEEVADELKLKGKADAKFFESVSVLFTDFKSFTKVSERLTPQQLVDELDACFKGFDEIVTRYDIEKIKTVGDAYMAACGLPVADANHADKVVKAAMEIRNFMINRRQQLGEDTFEVRIGIHSGPVVAGIVGIKKFAYDIWGDTVNTAARMEQNGAPGKINISHATYEIVKDRFNCEYRGEIDAKNKGKLKMYFVD